MRKRYFAAILAILSLNVTAARANDLWESYTAPDGSFTVNFPGTPQVTPDLTGDPVMTIYEVDWPDETAPKATYRVSVMHWDDNTRATQSPQTLLQTMQNTIQSNKDISGFHYIDIPHVGHLGRLTFYTEKDTYAHLTYIDVSLATKDVYEVDKMAVPGSGEPQAKYFFGTFRAQ